MEPAGQPRPEPPRPAPEFTNTKPTRFLDVVKGTSKLKLDDDQDTLPDEFISDELEQENPGGESADLVSVSPKSRSKHSSV